MPRGSSDRLKIAVIVVALTALVVVIWILATA